MQKEKATGYFRQGMQLLHADRLEEAIDFFSRAIEHDPKFAEAYRQRGEVMQMLGRVVEANKDLQQAKAISAGETPAARKVTRKVEKFDLKSVHNIYDDLMAAGQDEGDAFDFDDRLFDYVFSDDTLESDNLLTSLAEGERKEQQDFPAILEYLDGRREEVAVIHLFGPNPDEITLARREEGEEKVIALEQLACIRLVRMPPGLGRNKDAACHVEIIETIDGNIYHEAILPEQALNNVLYGFSTKQDSRFKHTLIPRSSIRKRFQRRQLGQILLEKKLIAGDVLKNALNEHSELKKVKFGKIIAQQAKILYSAVEFEIQRAYQTNQKGLKIGEILLNAGLVNEEQILAALEYQERLRSKKLGQFLVEKGILQEKDIYLALAEKFRIPFVDLRQQKVTRSVLGLLPGEVIKRLHILPLAARDNSLVVATLMPEPGQLCEVIHRYAGKRNVEFVLVQPSHLKNIIKVLFQGTVAEGGR